MEMMPIILLLLPVMALPLFWICPNKKILHFLNVCIASLILITGLGVIGEVIKYGHVEYISFLSIYLDSLSALILGIVLIVSFLVSIYCIGYLNIEYQHKKFDLKKLRIFYMLFYCFQFTMILSLVVGNIGIMWIAIEATTLSSAFLVGFTNDKESIEASWKYVLICSVAISLALLGVIFIHLSSASLIKGTNMELYWPFIYQHADQLNISALRISFIFILIGFGTKAGIAPMHNWLPDAHSQAPSPISAMLSAVLLNSAMYGIIRELALVNKALGQSAFSGNLLMSLGLLSILVAAIFLIRQKDYKRMLAYSSIEHMGIIAFSLGVFTPLSVMAALMHMINHSLTKAMLFLSAGNIYLKYETKDISKVRGLLKVLPITGTIFFIGIFAITGMPPFSVFFSELSIIIAAFSGGHYRLGTLFVILVTLVFVGFSVTTFKMFYWNKKTPLLQSGEVNRLGILSICILFAIIACTGFFIPKEVSVLISNAQKIIIGG